ncbi:MAG TPA: APC family permease [Acidimicrobiales bacterium]|jgi:amino acid transporter|nr:APC family permease [Acidimicrobiales bacterium]
MPTGPFLRLLDIGTGDSGSVLAMAKRLLVGRPLSSADADHQRLPKTIALATFSSDPISSTAYATEEILFVTAVGASSLALGLEKLVPMAIAVAVLLAIVVTSYRQTIFAYPSGGGAYIVSRENLGEYPSLVAAASLLVDYILTVAVSVSAGVAALVSLDAFHHLEDQRVAICLFFVVLLTAGNLRGVKESGKIFAAPTYIYIVMLTAMVVYGLAREFFGDIAPVPFDAERAEDVRRAGGELSLFLVLRGFSSGAVALSGVEAISNGVPAFRRPESKNAATTLTVMGFILGTLFLGVTVLAHHLAPYPTHEETVISQLGRAVFGVGPLHTLLQFATAGILILAANTAYVDFPRLASIVARDGYLPRQFANQGDRLVFSNGILFLAVAAGALLVAFGGLTTLLIPLYAVGVFTSFTLSQSGMVRHHLRLRERGWQRGVAVNAVGAVATAVVLAIVAVTKFAVGAWLPIVVVPLIIALFVSIKRHYTRVEAILAVEPGPVRPRSMDHTVVVLVGRVHRGTIEALDYARSLRPNHLTAVHVSSQDGDVAAIERDWAAFKFDIPLEIVPSPYRELTPAVERYLDDLDERWRGDTVTIVIPEFVTGRLLSPTQLLHNQSAAALKLALLFRQGTVVTSVPYHIESSGPDDGEARPGR